MFTLGELAERLGGRVEGDAERRILGVRALAAAGPDDLSFLTHPRHQSAALASRAGALLVASGTTGLPHDLLLCDDPSAAMAEVLSLYSPPRASSPGVHPSAVLGERCRVHESATIGPYVVLGDGCSVGPGVTLHAGAVLGRHCAVGADSVLHPRVVLYDHTEVGCRVILHAGVVLGSDGFGYVQSGGVMVKVPQVGRVVVEDDVEIGANSAVDRATLEETRIGARSKLDNLVQVGHNVVLGPGCILCGQAGIAGSARLGAGVVVGGQSGVAGHLEVGDGVQVAGKSAVFQAVQGGRQVAGIPAIEIASWRRQSALAGRLGEMLRRLRRLERLHEEES